MFKKNPFKRSGEQVDKSGNDSPPLPDYMTNPNAVLGDTVGSWRYGKAPDYSNTRRVQAATKRMKHEAGSLPELVENLVKNWEIEASFKKNMADCRTMDGSQYTFSVNGGPLQSASHMSKVGTYNAVIAPNEYYSPEHSDFNSSHKTFKRMMPTFAWEVLEVHSGPPTVAFSWRHWGQMKSDYVGYNDAGERVTAKAHGGAIDIQGFTVCRLTLEHKIKALEIWYDPLELFRQITTDTEVVKEKVGRLGKYTLLEGEDGATHLHGMDDAPLPKVVEENVNDLKLSPGHSMDNLKIGSMGACPFLGGSDDSRPTSSAESKPSPPLPDWTGQAGLYVPADYGDPWGGQAPFEGDWKGIE